MVIATPGRLLDLNSEGAAPLGTVSFLVLDEARRSHRPHYRAAPARPAHTAPQAPLRPDAEPQGLHASPWAYR